MLKVYLMQLTSILIKLMLIINRDLVDKSWEINKQLLKIILKFYIFILVMLKFTLIKILF